MKPINTSIANFKNLIESGCVYVDKTRQIYRMVREPFGQFFFSRPRRFGKSLTVSTLDAIFSGKRNLFQGLYIDSTDYSWEEYPVIHIDFGRSDSTTVANLEEWIRLELNGIARKYDVTIEGSSPAILFGELIKALYDKYDKGVVILIDEYDRPVTNNLEDGKGVKMIKRVMESFYQMIKGYEAMERFVFLTGVTRLSQVSVFSKLNNLVDISRSDFYSDLVGYTQEELEESFREHIEAGAQVNHVTYDELVRQLADWYDGFRFSFEGVQVYNPVSVGRFFNEEYEFRNFWYATATPVMLVNQAKKQRITVETIENAVVTDISYNSFDIMKLTENEIDNQSLIQLLLQTGYLTIRGREEKNSIPTYRLDYPNKEVRMSFETDLSSVYMGKSIAEIYSTVNDLQSAAHVGDVEGMISVLKSLFAGIPYDIHLKYEKYYQSLMYLTFRMCGMDILAESRTNIGRIDAVLTAGKYIYVIECKIDRSAREALDQINEMKYAERYEDKISRGYEIVKIGINFSTKDGVRNIEEYCRG